MMNESVSTKEGEPLTRETKGSQWPPIITAGLMGILGSVIGAYIGGQAATGAVEAQITADRETQAQVDRTDAYQDLLDSSSLFHRESNQLQDFIDDNGEAPESGSEEFADWDAARSEYQGAINRVHLYGSPEAIRIVTHHLAPALPEAVYTPTADYDLGLDNDSYYQAYEMLSDLTREELESIPTAGAQE